MATTTNYTANDTFVCPAGVAFVDVECWGAGAKGADAGTNFNYFGGAGGGGAYSKKISIPVIPSQSYTVTVGTTTGADSWFSTSGTVLAKGGSTGTVGSGAGSDSGGQGGQASAGIGDTKYNGGNGGYSIDTGIGGGGAGDAGAGGSGASGGGGGSVGGGQGGASHYGSGGNGDAGSTIGAGGGGSRNLSGGTNYTGGAGARGEVRITYTPSGATTQAVSDIGTTTATGNGTVVSDGGATITERGVVYNTSASPTTANFKITVSGTTGAFTVPMTGLTSGVLYYVRAYAINASGTFYGADVSFTTNIAEPNQLIKDIFGVSGETYAVSANIGGTTGTVTIKLGSTGASTVVNAGAGVTVLQGVCGGLNGLIFESSATFDGYIDDVMWVLVLGNATIDWTLDNFTNVYPINASVTFRRLENKEFDRFRIYRYLDVQFKDLNAYVTVLLKKEANEDLVDSSKQFLVSNTSGETLPFINKRISMLQKGQAMRIGISNNRLNETFTICQFVLKGMEQTRKLFDKSKIISI